jgi:hypothetical protein
MQTLLRVTPKVLALATVLVVLGFLTTSARALVCARDPSRTLFAGGPGTDACSSINDQNTCVKSFHLSGAGHLAPCAWDGSCFGNTANFEDSAPQSCELLPDPQTCIDPTRTIKLTGGDGDPRVMACQAITDEESCEMAWHTTRKGVGMACCWRPGSSDCVGSAWGFNNDDCTHGNTCFASSTGLQAAPASGTWGLVLVATVLLAFGVARLRPWGA